MYPNNNCNDCPDCPSTITPLPLPDLSGLCGDQYNAACVIYTGEDIDCLGIESGMTFLEVLNIFNNALPICGCCAPQDCVVSDWGPWGPCECYYEDELLVCGRRKHERTIITPSANGGTPCPPLFEYEPCDVPDVCFTFGSYICESEPNATQILASPTGILNNKPYYLLEFDCDAPDLYVWYSNSTLLWHITPALNVVNPLYQTLNNSSNYLPISNDTTQRWSFVEGGNNYLITTQTTTCPDVNICFEFVIQIETETSTFYANIAPIKLGEGSYPVYEWSNNEVPYGPYIITVYYDLDEDKWVYVVSNAIDTTPLIWGTLDTNTFYPLSTLNIEWQPVENIASSYNSQILSSTQDACTQPPDVDCIWTCTAWTPDPCVPGSGCTQTRTCTITTPASGNGTCLPKPDEQQSCCEPSCSRPLSPTVVISGLNVLVTFTAIPGAVGYTLTYGFTGGSPTSLISSLPSFSFPWVCGVIYNGSITTNCGTLTSDPTTFIIEIPACPEPQFCNGSTSNFISGNFNSPTQSVLKIDFSLDIGYIDSSKPVLSGISPATNTTCFMTNELGQDGIFLGGRTGMGMTDGFGTYTTGGVMKLKCNPTSSLFFAEIDRTFIGLNSGLGFEVSTGSLDTPLIHALKYHAPTNRLYVGGRFDKYKGLACSSNLVCLNASTGAIIPNTVFKLGSMGIRHTSISSSAVYDIEIDTSNPSLHKLIIAGAFTTHYNISNNPTPAHNIIRLNLDGTVDNTFIIDGTSFSQKQSPDVTNAYVSVVKTVYIDSIGDMYVGGAFHSYKGQLANNIVKIKNNGVIAPTLEFDSGSGFRTWNADHSLVGKNSGWFRPLQDGFNTYGPPTRQPIFVEKIVPHINGILVTGNFAYYNSEFDFNAKANGLIKLNLDGTRDNTFIIDDITTLPNTLNFEIGRAGYDIKVLSQYSILWGGYITDYLGGGNRGYYVLNSDGTFQNSFNITAAGTDRLFIKTIVSHFL